MKYFYQRNNTFFKLEITLRQKNNKYCEQILSQFLVFDPTVNNVMLYYAMRFFSEKIYITLN